MGIASKYNRRHWKIDTSKCEYISLGDLFAANGKNKIYPIRALYINTRSKFGDSPTYAIDEYLVNIPRNMLDATKRMLEDPEAVDAIIEGKLGFSIYQYTKNDKLCYGVEFIDM